MNRWDLAHYEAILDAKAARCAEIRALQDEHNRCVRESCEAKVDPSRRYCLTHGGS